MDGQLKRGLLDVCVLAAIRKEDSYGYQIIKDLKPCVELSESTLYTILKRLESAQMLTGPDGGSMGAGLQEILSHYRRRHPAHWRNSRSNGKKFWPSIDL